MIRKISIMIQISSDGDINDINNIKATNYQPASDIDDGNNNTNSNNIV